MDLVRTIVEGVLKSTYKRDFLKYGTYEKLRLEPRFVNARTLICNLRSFFVDPVPPPYPHLATDIIPMLQVLGLTEDGRRASSCHSLDTLLEHLMYYCADASYIPVYVSELCAPQTYYVDAAHVAGARFPGDVEMDMTDDPHFGNGWNEHSGVNRDEHADGYYGSGDSGIDGLRPVHAATASDFQCVRFIPPPSWGAQSMDVDGSAHINDGLNVEASSFSYVDEVAADYETEPTSVGQTIASVVLRRPLPNENDNQLVSRIRRPTHSGIEQDNVSKILKVYSEHVAKISGLRDSIVDGSITVNSLNQGVKVSENGAPDETRVLVGALEPVGTDLRNFRCDCLAHTGLSRSIRLKKIWSKASDVCVYRGTITTRNHGSDVTPHTVIFIDMGDEGMKFLPVISVLSQSRIVIDTQYVFGRSPGESVERFNAYIVCAASVRATTFTKLALPNGMKDGFTRISSGCIGSVFLGLLKAVHLDNVAVRWDVGAIYVRVTGQPVMMRRRKQATRRLATIDESRVSHPVSVIFGGGVVSS